MNRYSLCTLALLALTSHATAGNVLVVDDDPGGDFANIADAIQAAGPTDLILIRDGLYDAFSIQSKDVSLIADRDAQVTVVGQTSVFSLQADQSVLMRGLDFQALAPREALSIEDNQGSVWIEDAIIQGQSGFAPVALIFRDAVHAFHSDAVIFNNCDIRGGTAAGLATPAGGVGLRGSESFITVNASIIHGGDAPTGTNLSMPGVAVDLTGGRFVATGTTMIGGAGWDASQAGLPCASGGVGAIGLLLGGGSPEVFLRASSTEGGQGGAAIGPCANGIQGLSESIVSGFIDVSPFGDNRIETPGPVRFGEPIEFHYEGLGGEYVFLLTSLKMDPVFFEVQNLLPVAILLPGTYLTDLSQTQIVNLGAATFVAPGQPGVLDKTFTAPDVGMQGLTFYVQAMAFTPAAALPTVSVSNGLTLTLLDPAF